MGTLENETTRCQCAAIINQLLTDGWIDRDKALEICDCERLPARIWDLRHKYGMNIKTDSVIKKNRFGHRESHALYRLVKEETA